MKSTLPILLLFLLVLPAISPLFHPGFFSMHDDQQVIRLAELDNSLQAGQIPVRWVSRLGFGFGYPLFIFYPPFIYYLGELFVLVLSFSYLTAIKLVFICAFIVSAATMYLWVKHHYGRLAGIVAALFYTYAPYHAVDAFVRGALAELFSFAWLPLILLAIDRLVEVTNSKSKAQTFKQTRWVVILSGSFAGLIITHNLIALPFAFLLTFYFVFRFILSSQNKIKLAIVFSISIMFASSLSAFFWLPALAEKSSTLVDQILLQERYTYSLHYVKPAQLWNSLWGYGGSAPPDEIDGFSLKIGKLHILLSAFSGLVAIVYFLRWRRGRSPKFFVPAASFFLLLFSALMTTSYSSFIWDNFTPLQYIQFPWRFLTFTALFSSSLAGFSLYLIQHFAKRYWLTVVYAIGITILLLVPNLKLFQPQFYLDVTDNDYLTDNFVKWKISKTSFEFVPSGVATRLEPPLNITQLDLEENQVASVSAQIVTGEIQFTELVSKPHLHTYIVSSQTGGILRLNIFNFPGWHATINGLETTILDDNPLKLITLAIPPGDHTLVVKFSNTNDRTIANLISLISAIVFLSLIIHTSKIIQKLPK